MSTNPVTLADIHVAALRKQLDELRSRIQPGWTAEDVVEELRRMIDERVGMPPLIPKRSHADDLRAAFPDPSPHTLGTLITPKQLAAIRAVANAQGVNAEALCLEVFKVKPEGLSIRAASAFIDYLKKLPRERS
jgi:hypothetical protein